MSKTDRVRVLVVDDDAERRAQVAEALMKAGFETTTTGTGERALLLLRQRPRQIGWLVTQTDLPGLIDGWMLADEFHQTFPERPVIYTAALDAGRPAQTNAVFMDAPASPAAVVAALRNLDPGVGQSMPAVMAWAA